MALLRYEFAGGFPILLPQFREGIRRRTAQVLLVISHLGFRLTRDPMSFPYAGQQNEGAQHAGHYRRRQGQPLEIVGFFMGGGDPASEILRLTSQGDLQTTPHGLDNLLSFFLPGLLMRLLG